MPVGQPSRDDFFGWVGTLVDRFQHLVEHSDDWRALWDAKLSKPRNETIVHAVAAMTWTTLCESDAGRGPVDFKFSARWHGRTLIEPCGEWPALQYREYYAVPPLSGRLDEGSAAEP
jgi:hypothetical protein